MLQLFVQQLIEGLSIGSIYASLGLALTLIHRSTGIVNFAQGEMAMFGTFIAWQLMEMGVPIPIILIAVLALSFICGAVIQATIIRSIDSQDHLTVVIVTFGILLVINSLAGFLWGYFIKPFPSIFPDGSVAIGDAPINVSSICTIAVLIAEALLLYVLLMRTRIGLSLRAAASNPLSSRLVGINTERMFMIGWGMAAVVGSLSGIMVAPRVFLDPNMMGSILIFSFAGAAVGGMNSPWGTIVGCLLVGVAETLAGTYISWIGAELRILVPLFLIIAVLLFRPAGLFGSQAVTKV